MGKNKINVKVLFFALLIQKYFSSLHHQKEIKMKTIIWHMYCKMWKTSAERIIAQF